MAKTNDYGGQGLNRGSSFHIKKPLDEGVVWGDKAKKWLVRIRKTGQICTMGGHIDKKKAEEQYTILRGR